LCLIVVIKLPVFLHTILLKVKFFMTLGFLFLTFVLHHIMYL
jgi:hypothetical protein